MLLLAHRSNSNINETGAIPTRRGPKGFLLGSKGEKKKEGNMRLFEKLINQLQLRIQAEPMHGKYLRGDSAPF